MLLAFTALWIACGDNAVDACNLHGFAEAFVILLHVAQREEIFGVLAFVAFEDFDGGRGEIDFL